MNRIATVLVVAAALLVSSACAYNPYGFAEDRNGYERSATDNEYNRYVCRAYNYDSRYCR